MTRGLFDSRHELESIFEELAVELDESGITVDVVMAGGSWMLWHSQRASTRDVDSARRFDADVQAAINRVGAGHDLQEGWLNDAASPFWPSDANYVDCQVVFERAALVVRTPSPDVIFVMKLYRADPQDREDLISLWQLCSFTGPAAAVDAFTSAYPHAPDDEYLANYIAGVARDGDQFPSSGTTLVALTSATAAESRAWARSSRDHRAGSPTSGGRGVSQPTRRLGGYRSHAVGG